MGKVAQVLQVEVVTAVYLQPQPLGFAGCGEVGCDGCLAVCRIVAGIGFGVEFDAVCSGFLRLARNSGKTTNVMSPSNSLRVFCS